MSLLNSLERIVTIQTKRYRNPKNAKEALESLATDYFHRVCVVEQRHGKVYMICGCGDIPVKVRHHYCGMYHSMRVVFRVMY